ncbi:hypothetical protein PPSIR1_32322 [Plesiocystis pacifica SIR-1]|uniref:Lipoprotein n=1 Tax=Plesiocystis pacifica SIR-1 TaxID=391625 RepID=A6G5K0_9BACT|nr:hypothetical protein [Plesiocystis pacifica]EDM78781.1 hypothetical protein PPSIR1_32322 [Plesiocystis pacifica SIR-1]
MLGARALLGRLFLVAAVGASAACASASFGTEGSRQGKAEAPSSKSAGASGFGAGLGRELAARYALGLEQFNGGHYREAAATFSATFAKVPAEPIGDDLRHLLVQHAAWSLLGVYDTHKDEQALDQGEALLEAYLAKHEAIFPEAAYPDAPAEREAIYALLGEFGLRREGQPPPDANARLTVLVEQTSQALYERGRPKPHEPNNDDAPVRVIEVETTPWARVDDPRVQQYFQHLGDLGPSLVNGGLQGPGNFNPTRVLVRGQVHRARKASGGRAVAPARELLKSARQGIERCYEDALGRGAALVERVGVELSWDEGRLESLDLEGEPSFDERAQTCVSLALETAVVHGNGGLGTASAELDLTLFVQPERRPGKAHIDYEAFGFAGKMPVFPKLNP